MRTLQRLVDRFRLQPEISLQHLSQSRIQSHQAVMAKNEVFREVVNDIQTQIIDQIKSIHSTQSLRIAEIGSGAIPLSALLPGAISGDIVFDTALNAQFDAAHLPFRSNSIDVLVGQICFTTYQAQVNFYTRPSA